MKNSLFVSLQQESKYRREGGYQREKIYEKREIVDAVVSGYRRR